jgi:predicted ATPase/DNA-binding winged helix-turn-helix (wHTH) protein
MAYDGTEASGSRARGAVPTGDERPTAERALVFGPYLLRANMRRLERDGIAVQLGDRAFDILCVLTEHAGQIVTNRELLVRVWGKVVVGAGSLRFHINALRKALAQDGMQIQYIKNVTRRGYTFIAPVRGPTPDGPRGTGTHASELRRLPKRPPDIIGRAAEIKEITGLLSQSRFVTLVGSGGVGKTTVALELAHTLHEQFDLVCFVDLDTIKEPSWVARAVAAAAGLVVSSASPVSSLIAYFRDKRVLLILDSCERVLEASAMLAEQILDGCATLAVLATGQEALRADGERIYLLGPLRTPTDVAQLSTEAALEFPAIELFIARARAALPQFQLTAENGTDVALICRSVDGIPLAIELAAGRVGTLALPTIAKLLNTQFALSWPGRRTAAERHRTLGGAIAWAIDLLNDGERVVLRRLAVFPAPFTLEAAQCVAGSDSASVATALWNLVARSLVSSSCVDGSTHFWLLGVTRAFATRMLEESGESTWAANRHAIFFCEFLESAYAGSTEVIRGAVWNSHSACLGNVRSALAWTLRQKSGTNLIPRLAAAAGPFFLDLSLLSDCAHWAQIGLDALERSQLGSSYELELQASLGLSLFYARGGLEQARSSLNRGLQLAEELVDPYNQMRLLGALNIFHDRSGDLQEARRLAERAQVVALSLGDPACLAMANWLLGTSAHMTGDHPTARRICEQAWSRPAPSSLVGRVRFGFDDHRFRTLCALVRSLWLLGNADEARSAASRVLQEAEHFGHPIPLAIVLAGIAPVWIWMGEWEVAQTYVSRLTEHTAQHSMSIHTAVCRGFQGQLAVERGDPTGGLEALLEASYELQTSRFEIFRAYFAEPLARALAARGRMAEAIAAIDLALKSNEADRSSFMLPELLRAKGDLLAAHFPDHSVDAEALLRLSFEQARRQGALAWQLRAAMSLARPHSPQEHTHDTHLLLRDTYTQFAEGFGTRDLILARQALEARTPREPAREARATQAISPLAAQRNRRYRSQ